MAVPKYDELMKPLLVAVKVGGVYSVKDLRIRGASKKGTKTQPRKAVIFRSERKISKDTESG